jgi:hypothetical protein
MDKPGQLKPVIVTRGASNPQDEIATRNLLDSCLAGDTYNCPRCNYSTKDPELMIDHLASEINKSIEEVASLSSNPPKPKKEL